MPPLDSPSALIPKLCILSEQAQTFHVILNTIPADLLQTTPLTIKNSNRYRQQVTSYYTALTDQNLHGVNRSDAGSKVSPEELAEVAVLGQVLDGSVLEAAAEQPDVEAERRATQPRRQLELVEPTPQPRDQLQRHLTIQRHLSHRQTTHIHKETERTLISHNNNNNITCNSK